MTDVRHLRRIAALTMLAMLGTGTASADISMRYETSGDTTCSPFGSLTMAVQRGMVRMDTSMGGQRHSMLYDGVEEMMYVLDHDQKMFMTMEVDADASDYRGDVMHAAGANMRNNMAEVQKMQQEMLAKSGMSAEQQAQIQEQMAQMAQQSMANADMSGSNMTPEQQAQALELAQGMRSGDPQAAMRNTYEQNRETFKRTGETATVAGLDCAWRERYKGKTHTAKECVIAAEQLKLDARDLASLQTMFRGMRRMGNAMLRFMGDEAQSKDAAEDSAIVVQQTCLAGDREVGTARMVLDRGAADAALFEVPAGYSPMDMSGMAPGGDGGR